MDDYGDRVVLGFVMTTIAGLATAVGSALSFCLPKYNGKVFAVCLSLSAGVMFYVSFGEILKKSIDEFAESVSDEGQAYAYATTCFFAGILAAILLDYTLHVMFKWNHPEPEAPSNRNPVPDTMPKSAADRQHQQQQEEEHNTHTQPDPGATDVRLCACDAKPLTVAIAQSLCGGGGEEGNEDGQTRTPPTDNDNEDAENPPDQASSASEDNVTTEVGLATFAATLADPTFGLGVAVAIAIHNIPEGIAVSVPIFYATGSKWQAFGWSLLSGIAEPIGALLGYLVLMNVMSSMAFAILFGLVGGIMIHICIKKLIPTSLRYDPHDRVTSNTCLLGMAVMALSLVLFQVL
ncbi:unnamed protein product [Vitrella brassicaformis CCMP3155]|uniref:Zinc transporter n=1 Tax=Vitrella brassicaformis (strain CCMP3155) TaxID=1169540 RepID=A0A0G4G9E7_VITBC|nr:unnamed protein product [Vitrella brassicaformis CCMP3155]|eukprot:CEM25298.1 unnamed protein product [Vitrella brassicaformis CCMP3155]